MRKIKNMFLLILALSIFTELINGECSLTIESSPQIKPVFKKQFGSRMLKISKFEQNGKIKMFDGEILNAHCATTFQPIAYKPRQNIFYDELILRGYDYEKTKNKTTERNEFYLTLQCSSGEIYINATNDKLAENLLLTCKDFDWKIFESKKSLPWCSSRSTSFILATKLESIKIVGALCFNLDDMALESVNYVTKGANFTLTQYKQDILHSDSLYDELIGPELKDFKQISSNYDKWYFKNVSSELMEVTVYKDDTILQTELNSEIFRNYENLLRITWCHNLKYGNWKRFMRAFDERSADLTYNVIMGASGNLKLPKSKFCDGKKTGEVKFEKYNEPIPAFVWAYLKTLDESEEFVFISYNSPFYEFFNSTDIIFCQDICNEISWLSEVRSTFRYSTLGVSFCCSPQSVRDSKVLDGFPRIDEPPELEEIVTELPMSANNDYEQNADSEEFDLTG